MFSVMLLFPSQLLLISIFFLIGHTLSLVATQVDFDYCRRVVVNLWSPRSPGAFSKSLSRQIFRADLAGPFRSYPVVGH